MYICSLWSLLCSYMTERAFFNFQQQITVWIGVLHYVMVFLSFTSTFMYGIENDTWQPMALRAGRQTHTHTAHRNEHAEQQTGQGGQIARIRVSIIQNQFFLPLILLLHYVLHLFKIVTIPSRYYTNNTGNIPATTQHKTTIRLTQFGIKWWLS